jgi:hypothetical protein
VEHDPQPDAEDVRERLGRRVGRLASESAPRPLELPDRGVADVQRAALHAQRLGVDEQRRERLLALPDEREHLLDPQPAQLGRLVRDVDHGSCA